MRGQFFHFDGRALIALGGADIPMIHHGVQRNLRGKMKNKTKKKKKTLLPHPSQTSSDKPPAVVRGYHWEPTH
jgi:hypothetical protein